MELEILQDLSIKFSLLEYERPPKNLLHMELEILQEDLSIKYALLEFVHHAQFHQSPFEKYLLNKASYVFCSNDIG